MQNNLDRTDYAESVVDDLLTYYYNLKSDNKHD